MESPKRNFHLVSAALFVWVVVILARLVHLQVFQYDFLTRQAHRQQERTIEVSPVRGVIYDRNFHPLAMSVDVDSIFAVPGEIPNPAATARILAPVLGMEQGDLRKRLEGRRFFSWVKRKVSDREATRIRQLNLQGIYSQKESRRFYPKRELAAHVLGYVGVDNHGLAGVELNYEGSIRGSPGELMIETDARQNWLDRAGRPSEPGQNLVLTLDENIQYVAERELAAAMNEFHALSASVIVQDPHTGEILAMANQPTFNPNAASDASPEALRNLAVGASYEPGSTFKLVTVAAALEENVAQPEERIDCQMGAIVLAGHTIHDHQRYGLLSVNEIIQNSSDVGAIKLALRLGNDSMYRYMRSFGFGVPTGIELPGEARGLTKPPERWSNVSIGAIAMGQEVGVTPLQLVTAASAVANGGWWMKPHIVEDSSHTARAGEPQAGESKRVISEQTAAALRKMMRMVVTSGTAKTAQLNGYTSAGKTGTAQKINPATHTYSHKDYIASFVGFAPSEDPLFTILVVVDSPRGKIYGGDVAAPVFRKIAEQILAYRNVPPTLPVKPALVQAASTIPPAAPAVEGPIPGEAADAAEEASPAALLNLDSGLVVPDYFGKTVRAVAEESQSEALEVQMFGSGIAYRQTPVAGASLPNGQKVQVWFKVGGRVRPEPTAQAQTQEQGRRQAGSENKWPRPASPPKQNVSKPDLSKQRIERSISSGTFPASG